MLLGIAVVTNAGGIGHAKALETSGHIALKSSG